MTTHWYTSPDPPEFGEDLIATCGQIVSKAQPVMAVWDGPEGLVRCGKCINAGPVSPSTHNYAAVIQDGEESIAR